MEDQGKSSLAKPYLGILFECCQVYQRIYHSRDKKFYVGACPRCGRCVKVAVDSRKGTNQRFFRAR